LGKKILMVTPQDVAPSGFDDSNIPSMGTLEAKFLQESEPKQGIQFPVKQAKKKNQAQTTQNNQYHPCMSIKYKLPTGKKKKCVKPNLLCEIN
jgi:hypothetical protein